MNKTNLSLTIKPCGDCWPHITAPSGRKASLNLGQHGSFQDSSFIGSVVREAAEKEAHDGK